MPFFGDNTSIGPADAFSGGMPSQTESREMAKITTPRQYNLLQTVGEGVPMAAVDLADTLVSSKLVSWATGAQRGDVNRAVFSAIDLPGLGAFYDNNKPGIEFASGIAGTVAADLISRKITAPAGVLMKSLSALPYVRRIATLDAEYNNAMTTVRNVDHVLASRGAVGLESYVGDVTVDALRFDSKTGAFATQTIDTNRKAALFQAKGLGALQGVRQAAATELVMAAALNQNGMLYDDSAAHNLAWSALGLGLGAGSEWLHAGYQIRKAVNSEETRRAFANALDPGGEEEARLLWGARNADPLRPAEGFLGGSTTDRITSLAVSASKLKEALLTSAAGTDARGLLSNRERLGTQLLHDAGEELRKVTTKGITSNGFTRFTPESAGYGNHVQMVLHRDAAGFYGVEMMGGVPDNLTAFGLHQSHMSRLDERIAAAEEAMQEASPEEAEALTGLRRRLEFERQLTPQVLIDGERVPITEARGIEGFVEPRPVNTLTTVKGIGVKENPKGLWESHTQSNSVAPVSIDSDFLIHIPSGRSLDDADHFDIFRLYRAAQHGVDAMAKFEHTIKLPTKPNWFQLDMAEEILRRSENRAAIQWPHGMTRDSALVESIAQKAEAMSKWSNKIKAASVKAGELGKDIESELSSLRVRYNLPKLTAYERGVTGMTEHPVEALLRGTMEVGPESIRKMSSGELRETMAEFKRLGDIAPVTAADMDLHGNSFRYMLDESGRPVKPVLMYTRPFQKAEWFSDVVAERLAARKMMTVNTMSAADAGPLTQLLTDAHIKSEDFDLVARPNELVETQIQGGVTGLSPQSDIGAVEKSLFSSEHRDRDNPILLAASRLHDSVARVTRDYMRQVITDTFGDSINLLKGPRNIASDALLQQFHSYRRGWDLLPEPQARDDGFHAFTLADTRKNQERWAQNFDGAKMPEGQTLVSREGREIVLDDMSLDVQARFNLVSNALVKEKNTILRANGLPEIEQVSWYVPPPSVDGKYVGLVMDEATGKSVAGKGIVASTVHEFERLRKDIESTLPMGQVFRTQQEIQDFASIWDKAHVEMIDPSTTAIQPNKASRGVLGGTHVDMKAFEQSLQYVRDGFLSHAQDVTQTLLKEQLNASKARAQMAEVLKKNNGKFNQNIKYRSIYDMYIENLTGKSKLNSEGSVVGSMVNPIEGRINSVLESATPTASTVWKATQGWLGRANPWSRTKTAAKDFQTLSKALGEHMPFASAAELMEKQGLGARPWTSAAIAGRLNQFAAATLLRVMEVGQPIMNMAGVVNAMPAVIRQFTQREGENLQEYAARIGHSATIFERPDGTVVGIADMGKIMQQGVQRAWTAKADPMWQFRVNRGYMTQEVAEFHRQFGAIQSRSDWGKFFLGDQTIKSPKGIQQGLASKGVVGWLSVLSDKSEDLSRSWGHMTGVVLGEHLGIPKGSHELESFAHDFANKMIANYSPHNRPEIFQGALGSTLGLFQSFVMNYYERMFRYIETKDMKGLVTQFATQGALFGVTSLPGWKEFNQLMTATSEDGTDPTSALHHRLSGYLGDLVSGGVLSNLPKLFGADAIDLYTRGDVNIRLPGSANGNFSLSNVPAVAMVGKIMGGVGQAIHEFGADKGLSGARLAEIVSNAMPNRPMAGMIETWLNHGKDTDAYGQLVTETKSALEASYRLIGLRSDRQSREVQAFYANKNAMSHKAANDEVLRLATRAALRAGDEEAIPNILNRYLENGGDPRYFRRWMKQQYTAATSTRGERQLSNALKNPAKMGQVVRLLDAGVGIAQDEESPNPTDLYGQSSPGDPLDQDAGGLGQYPNQITLPATP